MAELTTLRALSALKIAAALCCMLPALSVPAIADDPTIEPGEWKVTSKTIMNGASTPPVQKMRCVSPQEASDVMKTFGPTMGTVNSTCKPAVFETTARTMKWRLECRGQLDMDVQGQFEFDTPTRYTAIVASKAWMAGALVSDVATGIEGERVGACQQ
jgi:hypothetical protein